MDTREQCLAVTVYNLSQGKGVLIGDYVAIPEPFLTRVDIDYQNMVKFSVWLMNWIWIHFFFSEIFFWFCANSQSACYGS